MKIFIAMAFAILLTAAQVQAMQTLHWNGREIDGWVCTGNELKPKFGANSSNTWVLQGNEIKPKFGANSSNTWIRAGNEIKPKFGADSSNTWVLSGNTIKPKFGANSSNTWQVGSAPLLVIAGKVILRLF